MSSFTISKLRSRLAQVGPVMLLLQQSQRPVRGIILLRAYLELRAETRKTAESRWGEEVSVSRLPLVPYDPRRHDRPISMPEQEELIELRDAQGSEVAHLKLWLDTERPIAYVFDVVVQPEYRGRRIAEVLLAEAARYAAEMGYAELRVAVAFTNRGARRAYARSGFRLHAVGGQVRLWRRRWILLPWWHVG